MYSNNISFGVGSNIDLYVPIYTYNTQIYLQLHSGQEVHLFYFLTALAFSFGFFFFFIADKRRNFESSSCLSSV